MDSTPGAGRTNTSEPIGLPGAFSGFSSAVVRFVQTLGGLFGLELRETGWHLLGLIALALGLLLSTVFAYLFLLLAAGLAVVSVFGAGLVPTALVLGVLHGLVAGALVLVLRSRIRRPLFPGTCEAVQREMERHS